MWCVICRSGEARTGIVTVTLERDGTTLIVRRVPATICANCGEEYVEDWATAILIKTAEEAARAGAHLDICEFGAAST